MLLRIIGLTHRQRGRVFCPGSQFLRQALQRGRDVLVGRLGAHLQDVVLRVKGPRHLSPDDDNGNDAPKDSYPAKK